MKITIFNKCEQYNVNEIESDYLSGAVIGK